MNFSHKLMSNNFTDRDISAIKNLLKKKEKIFTQSKNVLLFEKKWSKWLGVKYSVFVNSGSSANLISISILKILKGSGEVIVPSLTWVSDIASVIQNNLKPVFVDINPRNLCMSEEGIIRKVNKKTIAVFLSHIQGFNGLSKNLINFLRKKNILLIEDVCESHGATFNSKKLGTYGIMSNFSFYYAASGIAFSLILVQLLFARAALFINSKFEDKSKLIMIKTAIEYLIIIFFIYYFLF